MKIIFMGTPDFAVPTLNKLIERYEVQAVLTQPDRARGRGNKITMSPVKEVALTHGIPVYQPERIKKDPDLIKELQNLEPDFIIVVAFGQILPKEVLDIPKFGCINVHASLLPKYRGAAPLQWAVINGEKVSGVTTMLMDVGLDTGDMLLKREVQISEQMTFGELHDALMGRGAELLIETVEGIAKGTIKRIKQCDEESTYASPIQKELGYIQWNEPSEKIHNLVRGLNPAPVAYTNYKAQKMKVYRTRILKLKECAVPGTILDVLKEGIKVATQDGAILIERIQFPGGKQLSVEEYTRGNTIETGVLLT